MNATATASPDIFESLCRVMKMYPSNLNDRIKAETEALFAHCREGMDSDSQKLLATLLIKALNKKIGSESIDENIYSKKYETPQIQLFNILIEKFPFVNISQSLTNQAIVEAIGESPEVTIIDIGIGQGTQMLHIIESAKSLPGLKKMHLVGIEPFADALSRAEENIKSRREQVPFDLVFTSIHDYAENVDFSAIEGLYDKIIVNASLALHHIQSDAKRTETIANIKKINPAAFLLIEPNVNHFEPDFFARFQNCYNHYHALFQVIDRLDIAQNDKNALKLFFGREIEDVIGKDEKDRFEKHEPALRWIERLHETGFSLGNPFRAYPRRTDTGVEITYHPEGFLGFTFDKETVLAVLCAR